MSSAISAGTTSGTAISFSGDTSGQLVLQTNGTTTAVTISTGQVVTLAQPLPVASGGSGVTTSTGTGAVVLGTSPTLATPVLSGSVTGTYTLAGTPTMGASLITSGTAVASTSGTSIDFTGLPSWIRRVTVMYSNVSTNGSSDYLIRIGSGSVTASGYSSMSVFTGASSGGTAVVTTGFVIQNGSATNIISGSFTICLFGGFSYVFSGAAGLNQSGTTYGMLSGGYSPALSGALDRVRFTTVSSDTFDSGSVNILYE